MYHTPLSFIKTHHFNMGMPQKQTEQNTQNCSTKIKKKKEKKAKTQTSFFEATLKKYPR